MANFYTFLGRDIDLDINKGFTTEVLDSIARLFQLGDGQKYEAPNGDTLYYAKEKSDDQYRLICVVTAAGKVFQYGIAEPYVVNAEGATIVEIHKNSKFLVGFITEETPTPGNPQENENPNQEDPEKEKEEDKPAEPVYIDVEIKSESEWTPYFAYEDKDFEFIPDHEKTNDVTMIYKASDGTETYLVVRLVPEVEVPPMTEPNNPETPDITTYVEYVELIKPNTSLTETFVYNNEMLTLERNYDKEYKGGWAVTQEFKNQSGTIVVTVIRPVEEVDTPDQPEEPDTPVSNVEIIAIAGVDVKVETDEEKALEEIATKKKFNRNIGSFLVNTTMNMNGDIFSVNAIIINKETGKIESKFLFEDMNLDGGIDLDAINERIENALIELL